MLRDFHLLPERAVTELLEWLRREAEDWGKEWLPSCSDVVVTHVPDIEHLPIWDNALVKRDNAQRWCSLAISPEQLSRFSTILLGGNEAFDTKAESTSVKDLGWQGLVGFVERVLALLPSSDTADSGVEHGAPAQAFTAGAGSLLIAIEAAGCQFQVILSPQVVEDYLGDQTMIPAPPLVLESVNTPLHNQRLRGVCVFNDSELDLGSLAQLSVGDVITLDHSLDKPLRLIFSDTGIVCEGFLCQRNDRDSVMLISAKA